MGEAWLSVEAGLIFCDPSSMCFTGFCHAITAVVLVIVFHHSPPYVARSTLGGSTCLQFAVYEAIVVNLNHKYHLFYFRYDMPTVTRIIRL